MRRLSPTRKWQDLRASDARSARFLAAKTYFYPVSTEYHRYLLTGPDLSSAKRNIANRRAPIEDPTSCSTIARANLPGRMAMSTCLSTRSRGHYDAFYTATTDSDVLQTAALRPALDPVFRAADCCWLRKPRNERFSRRQSSCRPLCPLLVPKSIARSISLPLHSVRGLAVEKEKRRPRSC